MGGRHDDDDGGDRSHEYSAADLVPAEFDSVPRHASTETAWLYVWAAAVQLGQVAATAWGLNRLTKPGVDTSDKVVAAVVMIVALVVCIESWSAAYHSAADDEWREQLRRPDRPQ